MHALEIWSEFKSMLANRPEELTPVLSGLGLRNEDAESVTQSLRKLGVLDLLAVKKFYDTTKVSDVETIRELLSKLDLHFIKAEDVSTLLSATALSNDSSIKDWVENGCYKTLHKKLVPQLNNSTNEHDFVICPVCHSTVATADNCSVCGSYLER